MMPETTYLTLDPYIRIHTGEDRYSFGGNQMWFPKEEGLSERTLYHGGCGLVAVCDFMIWYCLKNRVVPKGYPEGILNGGDRIIEKDEYMEFMRYVSRHGYPVVPKLGSFSFEMSAYLNRFLSACGAKERVRFLWQNNPQKRLALVEDSIKRGYPCPLVIGPHILSPNKRGVNFYRMSPDGKLHKTHRDVCRHFVTITGVHAAPDLKQPVLFEISSWGQKLYISSEEYTEYIRRCSSPAVCGMFTLR